jgi:hypothetical protein
MNDLRRMMSWFVLALLFGWAGLSVFGAFLGADLAQAVFTSPPLIVFWLVFAVTQFAGFAIFAALRRNPGLMALHLGILLIFAGFMINSENGHRLTSKIRGSANISRSYLRLEEGQTSATVYDRSFTRKLGTLPFSVRLNAFEMEHYPPSDAPPPLLYGVLAREPGSPHFNWKTQSLKWKPGRTTHLADTPIRFQGHVTASAGGDRALSVTLELTANGVTNVQTLTCPPDEPFVRLALQPIFASLTNLNRSASLFLARPTPSVRTFRSRVTILRDGQETAADILVNRPLHTGGYHLYQLSWGESPRRYTELLVVSDTGTGLAFAGFILLGTGSLIHFWRKKRGPT